MSDTPGNRPAEGNRFRKGVSGNPSGRPKGYAEFKALCQSKTEAAVKALEDKLADDNYSVAAAKVLLEFGWGKPSQSVEVTGKDGGDFLVRILPPGGK